MVRTPLMRLSGSLVGGARLTNKKGELMRAMDQSDPRAKVIQQALQNGNQGTTFVSEWGDKLTLRVMHALEKEEKEKVEESQQNDNPMALVAKLASALGEGMKQSEENFNTSFKMLEQLAVLGEMSLRATNQRLENIEGRLQKLEQERNDKTEA